MEGKFNIDDNDNKYVHIVGNGSYESGKSNAHTLDWNGNAWYQGNITIGGIYNSETGVVDGAKTLVDEEVIERIKYYGDPNIIPSDESYFTVNTTGEAITGLTNTGKTQTELVIPYEINGKNITMIERSAFKKCTSLVSINIPNSVTSIGSSAFNGCSSLTSINIPNSITHIRKWIFKNCTSLRSITIPNSVTDIVDTVFTGCTNLTIYCEQGSYAETYAKGKNITVIYTDVKSITLTGQKTIAGGEIFNDYTNNKASAYSHAEGYKTAAGQMGHLITDDGWGDSTSKTYTLTSVDGLSVNDTVSMQFANSITNNVAALSNSYDDFAKITAINTSAKTITVDTYQSRGGAYGIICVKSKPFVGTIAIAAYSHAEGKNTTASGSYSHAEGDGTTASGSYSHAEGFRTQALGNFSHAEGNSTHADGSYSHAEGNGAQAMAGYSHAEGYNSAVRADANFAHVEGWYTVAASPYQHVQGKCNIVDNTNTYAHIVGNGNNPMEVSNAHTLDWNGNAWYKGNIKVGGTSYDDVNAKELVTSDKIIPNSIFTINLPETIGTTFSTKTRIAYIKELKNENLTLAIAGAGSATGTAEWWILSPDTEVQFSPIQRTLIDRHSCFYDRLGNVWIWNTHNSSAGGQILVALARTDLTPAVELTTPNYSAVTLTEGSINNANTCVYYYPDEFSNTYPLPTRTMYISFYSHCVGTCRFSLRAWVNSSTSQKDLTIT